MASRAKATPAPKRGVKRKGPPEKNEQEEVPSSGESEFEYEEYEDEEDDEEEDDDEGDEEDSDYDPQSDSDADMSEIGDDINLQEISDDEALGEEVADDADTDGSGLFTKVLHDNDNLVDVDNAHNQSTVQSISHDTKPILSGENVASVDEYEHDSSDEEDVLNTIGNIPYEWYKDYVHIGYDRDGRKIIKPPNEDEIDEFLRKMDDPMYWRTVKDNLTGQKVVLSDTDVDLLQRLRNGKCPDPGYDPYAPFIDFFTYEKSIHPAHNRPETKASFIPSISEKRLVSKLVTAIKKARLKPKPKPKKDSQFAFSYDLWEHEADPKSKATSKRHDRYIAAPKPRPPGHEESYNPPPEYLFSEEEKKAFEEAQNEEEEEDRPRPGSFIPQQYSRLRSVPAYPAFVKERFERCLDLYLCPRARKNRVQINPEDLIPQLPKPADLQPFPAIQSLVYTGHTGKVLSSAVEPAGQFLVSGDDTGSVKVFEVLTGRCFKTISGLPGPVTGVTWYPNGSRSIVSAIVDRTVYLINIGLGHRATVTQTDEYFARYTKEEEVEENGGDQAMEQDNKEEQSVEWQNIDPVADEALWSQGVRLLLKHKYELSQLTWHTAGEYFATAMPAGTNKSVVIHHLSKRKSQVPFKKSKDIIKCVQFHPTRAYFFVATKKSVRVYDLIKQELTKKLIVNTCEVNCMAVHPGGDNVLIGGVDPKVQWFDMDLSVKAYKTLRYHRKGAVRAVQFHSRYPLFASASDDGTVVVCHGMVYDDLLQNALIVPVKVLKAPKDSSPMMHCAFHSVQPWLFACSTNTVRLFT